MTPPAQRGLFHLLVSLFVLVLVGAACGSDAGEASAAGDGDGRVVTIGLVAPLSGDLVAVGAGIRNSAALAVKQANEAKRIEGWRIVLDAQDDQGNPEIGSNAAAKLVDDPSLVAVVGTFNSSVAEKVAPFLDREGIVMISPGNTNPTLTQGPDPAHKARPFDHYFRVVTTDAVQGPFGADYAYDTLGARRVVIIHDKKTYGQGLALAFKGRFEEKGGTVPAVETVGEKDQDFSAVLSKVAQHRPDLIYYGGEYPAASRLTSQAAQQGVDAPIMGGDGIFNSTYVEVAGEAANGDFATFVGAPTEDLPAAQAFVEAYEAAGYEDPFEAFGAYAYDATNVIIDALAKVLPGTTELDETVRGEIRDAVQAANHQGITGPVAFDEFGDTTTRVLTVYQVQGGAWTPKETAEFK